jgi:RNA polymerase sigma factor (sigma-70 family)
VNFLPRRRILAAMSRREPHADTALVARALQGDGASLDAAFEPRRPQLLAAAQRVLRDRADAQDAVQDSLLAAPAHLAELRDPGAFGGWLLAILRNPCLQLLRSRKAEVRVEDIGEDALIDGDAERRLGRHALRDWIAGKLSLLPEPLQLTTLPRCLGSYPSHAEVAPIFDVPVGTVRSRLAEVKRRLGEAMLADAGLADDPHDDLVDARWRPSAKRWPGCSGAAANCCWRSAVRTPNWSSPPPAVRCADCAAAKTWRWTGATP